MNAQDLNRGDVVSVCLGIYDGIHPKDGFVNRRKYFVVLGICKGYALLGGIVFNTSVNRHLTKELQSCHIPVSCRKYPFLEHDSFFDCSKLIKPRFSTMETAQLIGAIDDSDFTNIVATLRTCSRVRKIELEMFGL